MDYCWNVTFPSQSRDRRTIRRLYIRHALHHVCSPLMFPISALVISLGFVLVQNPRFLDWGVDGPVFLVLVTIMAACHNRSFELVVFFWCGCSYQPRKICCSAFLTVIFWFDLEFGGGPPQHLLVISSAIIDCSYCSYDEVYASGNLCCAC